MYGVGGGGYQQGYQIPQIGQQYGSGMQQYTQQPIQGGSQGMQYAYQQQQAYQFLKSRPVANFEEVNAAMIDLDGSTFVFPCEGKKRIYTKQIGLDGNPIIRTYVLEEQEQTVTEQQNVEYVLKSDYEKAIKRIEAKINKVIKGGQKNEHDGNDVKNDDE